MTEQVKTVLSDQKSRFLISDLEVQKLSNQVPSISDKTQDGPVHVDRAVALMRDMGKIYFNPARSFARSKVGMVAVAAGGLLAGNFAINYGASGQIAISASIPDPSLGTAAFLLGTVAVLAAFNLWSKLKGQRMRDKLIDGLLDVVRSERSTSKERQRAMEGLRELGANLP